MYGENIDVNSGRFLVYKYFLFEFFFPASDLNVICDAMGRLLQKLNSNGYSGK